MYYKPIKNLYLRVELGLRNTNSFENRDKGQVQCYTCVGEKAWPISCVPSGLTMYRFYRGQTNST